MGRFSTTVQIKDNVGRMVFINSLCDVMKKRGFVPCSEDEAVLSYLLAFGEGAWVTLANEEYKDNPQKAYDDSREMAAALKTSAFSVEVVDSDFALLKLSNPNGGEDEVIVGDGSGYGIEEPTRGERQYWGKLLADGKTWEQFSKAAAKNEVFVEDALAELAGVLGIEPYYIDADYDEVSDKANSDNVAAFYFKKAAAKAKTMSLNAAFKQVFGEALEPLGFKLIKSKYPYFVRVVSGGEIIHVISVKKKSSYLHAIGREGFTILSGAATVYRPKIDLSVSPRDNTRWLSDIMSTYIGMNRFNFDSKLADSLSELSFVENNSESQFEAMKLALEQTENIVIPALNKAVDIDSFARICFIEHDGLNPEWHFDSVKGGELNPNDVDDEGLVLVKVKDYPSFVDWSMDYRKNINSRRVGYKFDKYSEEDYTEFCSKIGEYKQQYISKMKELKNDIQFYDLIELELEKRKRLNTEILKSYGLDI